MTTTRWLTLSAWCAKPLQLRGTAFAGGGFSAIGVQLPLHHFSSTRFCYAASGVFKMCVFCAWHMRCPPQSQNAEPSLQDAIKRHPTPQLSDTRRYSKVSQLSQRKAAPIGSPSVEVLTIHTFQRHILRWPAAHPA